MLRHQTRPLSSIYSFRVCLPAGIASNHTAPLAFPGLSSYLLPADMALLLLFGVVVVVVVVFSVLCLPPRVIARPHNITGLLWLEAKIELLVVPVLVGSCV